MRSTVLQRLQQEGPYGGMQQAPREVPYSRRRVCCLWQGTPKYRDSGHSGHSGQGGGIKEEGKGKEVERNLSSFF